MKVVSFIFLSCYVGWALCALESNTASVTERVPATPPCAMPQESLYRLLEEIILDGLDLYINCLSFGRNSALVRGVISGVNRTDPMTGGERVELTCVGGGISGRPSALPPSTLNMTTSSCLSCMSVMNETQICQERKLSKKCGPSLSYRAKTTKEPFKCSKSSMCMVPHMLNEI